MPAGARKTKDSLASIPAATAKINNKKWDTQPTEKHSCLSRKNTDGILVRFSSAWGSLVRWWESRDIGTGLPRLSGVHNPYALSTMPPLLGETRKDEKERNLPVAVRTHARTVLGTMLQNRRGEKSTAAHKHPPLLAARGVRRVRRKHPAATSALGDRSGRRRKQRKGKIGEKASVRWMCVLCQPLLAGLFLCVISLSHAKLPSLQQLFIRHKTETIAGRERKTGGKEDRRQTRGGICWYTDREI